MNITLQNLNKRKAIIDENMLGKTLAYSPYTSRVDVDKLRVDSTLDEARAHIVEKPRLDSQFKFLEHLEDKSEFLLIDTSEYDTRGNVFEALEMISTARRFSTKLLIHKDIFLEPYQFLESALYGSDMVMIDASNLLQKELGEMISVARAYRLEPIISISSKSDLSKAIFSQADVLFIDKEHFELLSLIPQNKIIFSNHFHKSCDMILLNHN